MNLKIYNKIFQYLKACKDQEKDLLDSFTHEEKIACGECLDDINDLISSNKPDYDGLWERIDNQIRYSYKDIIIMAARYAAMIVVTLGISYICYFLYNNFTYSPQATVTAKICQKSNTPTLILSNGNKVNLADKLTNKIIKSENIEITDKTNQVLSYKKNNQIGIENKYNTIIVPKQAEYSVKLSDGTVVKLNSDSKLVYPTTFIGDYREVSLEGEAYFQVAKNKSKPFIVKVHDVNVKVLGTIFNINAYKENDAITTTLVEGSVKVKTKNKSVILKPEHQAKVANGDIECCMVNIKKQISWIRGAFYFENTSLENVMIHMERWYNVNVFFIDQAIKKYHITGVLKKYIGIDEMLYAIEKTGKIKIRRKDRNVYIEKK